METLTAARLREVLNYDPNTGAFTWRSHRNKVRPGTKAGTLSGRGYVQIRVDYKRYYAHRLAWLHVHGVWPDTIDHLNGDGLDNRIVNLRDVSQQVNLQNIRAARNKHGFTGVVFHRRSGLYHSTIKVNKRATSLGYYRTPEEAHRAYLSAKAVRDAA